MTPKEKAQELIDSMGISKSYMNNYTGGDDIVWYENTHAKECALKAVDEIKEVLREVCDEEILGIHMIYWTKVKQEIEKSYD